jgi:hypothetical protein
MEHPVPNRTRIKRWLHCGIATVCSQMATRVIHERFGRDCNAARTSNAVDADLGQVLHMEKTTAQAGRFEILTAGRLRANAAPAVHVCDGTGGTSSAGRLPTVAARRGAEVRVGPFVERTPCSSPGDDDPKAPVLAHETPTATGRTSDSPDQRESTSRGRCAAQGLGPALPSPTVMKYMRRGHWHSHAVDPYVGKPMLKDPYDRAK